MRNLLFLSYYFPPAGGVLRIVKLAKYLPRFGWHPLVVCPRPRGIYRFDPSLARDTARSEVFGTFSFDPAFLSAKRNDPSLISRRRGLIGSVNSFFIPDSRIGWVPFAVRRGLQLARCRPIDAIFSSAPPYSSHLAGLILRRATGRPLVCDFRDAWSQPNPLSLGHAPWQRALNRRLEARVVAGSDLVTAINEPILSGLQGISGKNVFQRQVLDQGYDPEDFPARPPAGRGDRPFTIAYTGTLTRHRKLDPLVAALSRLQTDRPDIVDTVRVVVAGVHSSQDRSAVDASGLAPAFEFHQYLSHDRVLEIIGGADALWMVIGRAEGPTVATSKIYEYLGTRTPILASVPLDGPAAKLVEQTGSGRAIDPDDVLGLATAIRDLHQRWKSGRPLFHGDAGTLARYDRRFIAEKFARTLDRLVGHHAPRPST